MTQERIAVIDFETTGMSPQLGCRTTEIGAVIIEGGQIVDRYQSLMNAGVRIPAFIEGLTGISNAMVRNAPPAADVMREVAQWIGDTPLVAHNAAFDQKFWDAELARVRLSRRQSFACSLLLARRLLPEAPNHKLGTLNTWAKLPITGRAHRALADAEMAANLLLHLTGRLQQKHGVRRVTHTWLCQLQKIPAAKIEVALTRQRELER